MKITPLTTVEEQLMLLLWKLNRFYMKDIMEQHPEPKPHQNTISTYLKILVEKGYLSTQKEGRINLYSVAVPMEEYRKSALQNIAERFYGNSGSEILKFLFDEKLIAKEDLMAYFDLTIKMKPAAEPPALEIAEEILKPKTKKDKKKKKKKK